MYHASAAALSHGELDLNVWESLMTCNVLDMIDMLSVAMHSLAVSAFTGLRVISSNIQRHLESPIAALTELARSVGYSEASRRARQTAPDRED